MKLVWIHLKFLGKKFIEETRVIFRYYSNFHFFKIDQLHRLVYFFRSPYRLNKRFLKKNNKKNLYTYGETPLTTLDYIMRQCQILSKDVVFDLGCGTGRTTFWLHAFVRCKTIGIDYLPQFIQKANRIKKWGRADVKFRLENFLESDFRSATAIYLYGTSMEDSCIRKFAQNCKELRGGTKIITVSFPISEYANDPSDFKTIKHFTAPFPWGDADIYLSIKT